MLEDQHPVLGDRTAQYPPLGLERHEGLDVVFPDILSDVAPTLLARASLSPAPGMTGRDLARAILRPLET